MLDEVEEGCSEVDVDSVFVLEDKALEMLDDIDLSPLVKDWVALEDEPFVLLDGIFLVLVEVVLMLEDNNLIALVEISLEAISSVLLELVEGFVMLVDRELVLDEIFVTLDKDPPGT
jgi:hypothetical protein